MEKILIILFGHFIGDYLFQSSYLAGNKGKDNYILLAHSVLYTAAIYITSFFFLTEISYVGLILIGVIHYFVDYLKARGITTKIMGDKKALCLDQIIHFITLFIFI